MYVEEEELVCECVQIDVDLDDARYCPAHGPHSPAAKRQREQEADEEARFWRTPW